MFESLRYWGTSLILCTGISFNTWAIDFSSGTGTMEDPFVISTADELNNMRNNLAAQYKLEADIDLSTWIETNSPETGWQPIGTSATPFTGNFDGNGHAIENIWISMDSENVGFFGAVGGNVTIKRLAIIIADGKRITGTSNVGILTGLSTAVEGNKQTQIEEVYTTLIDKCYVLNNIQVDGGGSTGGILGTVSAPDASIEQMNATISNCVAINKTITVRDATPSRIFAWAKQEKITLSNNLAFSGCIINDAPFSSTDANGKNGQDKDAEELAIQSTYDGWDFESVWTLGNEAYQLPVLKTVSLSKQPVDEYNLGVESDNPFVDLVPKGGELNVVESCGVSNNGRDDVTELMQQAIDACSMKKATVIVPKGRYSIRPSFYVPT